MRHRSRPLIALGAVAALGLGAAGTAGSASATSTTASKALALTSSGKTLRTISLTDGSTLRRAVAVTGLDGDSKLIGIDVRVQDRKAYGVGNRGGVYKINRVSGKVFKVSQLTVALNGAKFGVDFNPAANRLRVISDTGQNLRHDVDGDVTTNDGALAYPAVAPSTTPTPGTGLTAAAYVNNDLDSRTGTTLFDIDTNLDQVVQQVPANAGTLVVSGKLGRNIGAIAGFDITSKVSNGRAVANTGYASVRSPEGGRPTLYKVDLLSGSLTKVATFKSDVADIAIQLP